ncbi:MAG: Rossmann-fold NAD(P)-binding domain-containing protein, partial [Planctomycetota bacterium]
RTADYWSDVVHAAAQKGQKPVLWGSGSKGVSFLTTLGIRDEIECVVDINPFRQGRFMPGTGHPIVAPSFLAEYRPDLVIAMNPMYRDEIRGDLDRLKIQPEIVAV